MEKFRMRAIILCLMSVALSKSYALDTKGMSRSTDEFGVDYFYGNQQFSTDNYVVNLKGLAYYNMGNFNYSFSTTAVELTEYSIYEMESILSNAKTVMPSPEQALQLEENLNKIYMFSGKNRRNYLPFFATTMSQKEVLEKLPIAYNRSITIIDELNSFVDGSFEDKYGLEKQAYRYGSQSLALLSSNFSESKQAVKFRFTLVKISNREIVLRVAALIPMFSIAKLYKMIYIPGLDRNDGNMKRVVSEVEYMFTSSYGSYGYSGDYVFVKKLDLCKYYKGAFICDDSNNNVATENGCLREGFSSYYVYNCVQETLDHAETFTQLNNELFFFNFGDKKANYIYQCKNSANETGHLGASGVITLKNDCTLSTAFVELRSHDAFYEKINIINNDLVDLDRDYNQFRILGIPLLIFIGIVAGTAFVLLTCLCLCCRACIRKCKQRKSKPYVVLDNNTT